MRRPSWASVWMLAALVMSACAPRPQTGSTDDRISPAASNRTLVVAVRTEPDSLAVRPVVPSAAFAGLALVRRFANAELTLLDDRLELRPYLAASTPRLNTDSWRVFADGTMETTWTLRPGIFWQDGAPLSAEDFAFAWRVYSVPELGATGSRSI